MISGTGMRTQAAVVILLLCTAFAASTGHWSIAVTIAASFFASYLLVDLILQADKNRQRGDDHLP